MRQTTTDAAGGTPSPAIARHAPVVGSDGAPLGTADRVQGAFLRLARPVGAAGARHRWLPLSTVAALDGAVVRLALTARRAEQSCLTEAEVADPFSLAPDAAESFRPVLPAVA